MIYKNHQNTKRLQFDTTNVHLAQIALSILDLERRIEVELCPNTMLRLMTAHRKLLDAYHEHIDLLDDYNPLRTDYDANW